MVVDVGRRYPRIYRHRHKLHQRPDGFGAKGPAEMHHMLHAIDSKISGWNEGRSTYQVRTPTGTTSTHINKVIYESPPHGTADNYFSGDAICNLAG